jgi:hypothetical protein
MFPIHLILRAIKPETNVNRVYEIRVDKMLQTLSSGSTKVAPRFFREKSKSHSSLAPRDGLEPPT